MVYPNNSRSRTQYNKVLEKNLDFLTKKNSQLIHIPSGPELLPIKTRIQDWLNSKSKFSQIPFEDNIFWEGSNVSRFYINPLDIFCPGGICRNNSTRGWLFHDADHLSELGASKLKPALETIIKEILRKKS